VKARDAIPDARPAHGDHASSRHDPVTFVIVLWLEPRDEMREPEWRWRVREVRDGEEASFRRLDDVLAYIAARSGTAGPA